MSRFLITRRAGLLAAAAAAGVLGAAAPALADVTVDPATAPQGGGETIKFHVTNTEQTPITRIKLVLPADTPIAEVYPLSVNDWAPLMTNRKLATPLATIHGGTPATETTADITWIAVPGRALATGRSADLSVDLGPLPTLSQIQFTLRATYAPGTAPVALPPVSLKLTPATAADQAAQEAGHAGHDAGGTADGTTDGSADGTTDSSADDAAFAALVARADQGPSTSSVLGWIVAALAAVAAAGVLLRNRRRPAAPATADEPADGEDKEPVGAAAGKSRAWRYQDGPQ